MWGIHSFHSIRVLDLMKVFNPPNYGPNSKVLDTLLENETLSMWRANNYLFVWSKHLKSPEVLAIWPETLEKSNFINQTPGLADIPK